MVGCDRLITSGKGELGLLGLGIRVIVVIEHRVRLALLKRLSFLVREGKGVRLSLLLGIPRGKLVLKGLSMVAVPLELRMLSAHVNRYQVLLLIR